jgi:osmotically-inducible protein OsmY
MTKPRERPLTKSGTRNLVLVGSAARAEEIERALAHLDATLRTHDWGEDLTKTVGEDTVAVIVTESPPTAPLWKSARTLRQLLDDSVALVVLVPGTMPLPEVKRLYRIGSAAVLEWPRDSKILARMLVEVLALRYVHGPASKADMALARVVKAVVRSTVPSAGRMSVTAKEGVVSVVGTIPGLWVAAEIERSVAGLPGVRGVLLDELQVEPSGRSDRSIRQAVRRILDNVTSDTVSVAVQASHVTLAGSVTSRAEARRLRELVSHVRGVRGIENRMVVSEEAQARDTAVATRASRVLDGRFPHLDIAVQVFGGHAVLEGRVHTLADRKEVRQVVEDVRGVRRVVDKLAIPEAPEP